MTVNDQAISSPVPIMIIPLGSSNAVNLNFGSAAPTLQLPQQPMAAPVAQVAQNGEDMSQLNGLYSQMVSLQVMLEKVKSGV